MKWSEFVEKIRRFFGNRKVLAILIIVVTFLIIAGFFSLIYFKDQPKFVPERTRENIREGVKGAIVEPLKSILPSIGQTLSDAEYRAPSTGTSANGQSSTSSTDTSTWQTYKNDQYGYEIKYPGDVKTSENVSSGFLSSISFWSEDNYQKQQNGVFPEFDVNVIDSNSIETASEWLNKQNNPPGLISDIKEVSKNYCKWLKAIEVGDPDHVIYVLKINDKIYKIITSLEEPQYINEVLENFKAI